MESCLSKYNGHHMKLFVTAPFLGTQNKREIEELCALVHEAGFEDFCFVRDVEKYQHMFDDVHELMRRAKEEISKCDALLMDYDGPANGRMIELGIAFSLGKTIIVTTRRGTSVKDTVRGVADVIIEYDKLADIVKPLSEVVTPGA